MPIMPSVTLNFELFLDELLMRHGVILVGWLSTYLTIIALTLIPWTLTLCSFQTEVC